MFFAPINYKGQTVGFNVQTSQTCEVRYGFAEYVSVGTPAYYFGQTTTSEIGNIATKSNITCPIDKGFFIVCVYQGYSVTNISMYSQDTVAEIVGNSTQTILEGQQQIRDDIVQGQNEINDTLTSTDYDESVVNIDSSAVDDFDDSSSNQLFTTIFTNFSDLLDNTNWNEVEIIQLGLPYTDKKIELRSDILSNIVRGSALSILITISWYSLFGLYCFRFVTHIYRSIKSGDVLNGLSLKMKLSHLQCYNRGLFMFNTLMNLIFTLIAKIGDLILAPLISAISVLIPSFSDFISYIIQFIDYGFTYMTFSLNC